MAFGTLISRMSGFHCTACGAPLRYFPLLGTFEGGLAAPAALSVACEGCGAEMCLVEHRGWWSPFRLVIGILPELVLAFAVLLILRWLFNAAEVPGLLVAAMILGKAALFLPVGLAVAVMENRLNHRVQAAESLTRGRGGANEEETP
jgi:hypothetical protein